MSLAMGWDEWVGYDAVGLAQLVRQGQVSPAELAAQAAAAIDKVNPALSAVVEVFDDVVADPGLLPACPG
jgi:amidase